MAFARLRCVVFVDFSDLPEKEKMYASHPHVDPLFTEICFRGPIFFGAGVRRLGIDVTLRSRSLAAGWLSGFAF